MTTSTIGFIGAGNMARSLAGGLLNSGWAADHLLFSDPDANQRRGMLPAPINPMVVVVMEG